MLTLKQQGDIYDLLCQGFSLEKRIPLATLALYLKEKGISYEELGYKKFRSLLNDLQFLECVTSEDKKRNDVFIIIHPFERVEKKESKKEKTLDEKEKTRISELLLSQYEGGKNYPLSAVSKFLFDSGVEIRNYGFGKMRKFLLAFDSILSVQGDEKDSSQFNVHFLKLKKVKDKSKKEEAKKENKKATKESPKKEVNPYEGLPLPKDNCFYIPSNLILSLKEFAKIALDNDTILKWIFKDYKKAYEKLWIVEKDDSYIFPLSLSSKDGDTLICAIKKATKGSPYTYFANFIGSDREKPKDVLDNHVYFASYEQDIHSLAALAIPEAWCYHHSKDKHIILKIYLQYTFFRIVNQNKLSYDKKSGYACFNTGLKNAEYEDIYAVLTKNSDKKIKQEYVFNGFAVSGGQGLGKIIVEHFNPLPLKASYISSSDELFFDPLAEIHTDYRHIILDNLNRFPIEFLQSLTFAFAEERNIVTSIIQAKNDYQRDKLYAKLEKAVSKNETLCQLLKLTLENAINKAKRMVSYDYRNALPSYFPTRDVMSLMLPLEFVSGSGPQAVLLIEKTASGNYQGQTMLTLKQCYVNARLIGALDNTFLNAKNIED